MTMRVLIVDDEPLVRRGLAAFLRDCTDVDIVGEAAEGREALTLIRTLRPDLVFLDVQMPEMDGFAVLAQLGADEVPEIIFVTAFDEYALKAFDVHAVDYLLKPFDQERFAVALDRARDRLARNDERQEIGGLLTTLGRSSAPLQRILVKDDGRITVVAVDEIDWIQAADNYARIHTGRGAFLLRETMRSLEERLDPSVFVRVHRSSIVNLTRVRELHPLFGGEYTIVLTSGDRLTLSRGYRDSFRDRLAGAGEG